MITKFITFKLDLPNFDSIKQIIQLSEGYVILGEQIIESKLKSMKIAITNQGMQYFEIQNGNYKLEKPYIIGQGLYLLSNIAANEKSIVALISRQGNRSLIQFNPKEHSNFALIPNLAYKDYQLDCESVFYLVPFNDKIFLIEIHKSIEFQYLELLSHPNSFTTSMKLKKDQIINIQKIHNTHQILIIIDEDFYIFNGQKEAIKINQQMPIQFKIKFVIEIKNQLIFILKDRLDKFYKFCDFGNESDYYFTLKCKELLNGQVKVDTQKKQSINVSKFKDEFYIWISTIYELKDEDSTILYINAFKLNSQLKAEFIETYKFWKSQKIQFIFKDEFVREYILYKDEQKTIKGIYIS